MGLILDTTAPSAPVVTGPANGAFVANTTPTVTGTAEAYSTVTVYVDGSSIGTTAADPSGNWIKTVSTLGQGSHTFYAKATDVAGNTSVNSNTNTTTIDTIAPAAPVVTGPANGGSLATTTPTFSGIAEPNTTVTVVVDGASVGTTTVSADGRYTLTQPTALSQGSHTVRVTDADPAGNVSPSSETNTFTVDTVHPTPTVSTPSASPTSSGTIPYSVSFNEPVTDFVADDVTVTNGTLNGFSSSGSTYTFNVTPAGTGTVTVSVAANTAHDAAGNGNPASNSVSVQYQQPVTAAPVVLTPVDGSATNAGKPTITGTAPAGSTVTVFADNQPIGSTTATAGGTFTLTAPGTLADGSHRVYATAQSPNATVSAISNTDTFTIDTTAPETILLSGPPEFLNTSSPYIAFTGTDGSGTGVARYEASFNGGSYLTVISPISFAGLPEGPFTVRIRAIDQVGNVDATPVTSTFTVDLTAPTIAITTPVAGDNRLNAAEAAQGLTLSGTTSGAEGGQVVTVKLLDSASAVKASYTSVLTNDGTWSATLTPDQARALADGSYTIAADVSDKAGNAATTARQGLTVDQTIPTITSIVPPTAGPTNATSIVERVTFSEAVTGVDPSDFTITGTETARAVIGALTAVSATAYDVSLTGITGTGTLKLGLASGVTIQDMAGNALSAVGGLTTSTALDVDRDPPATPAAPRLAAASDTGPSQTDGITGATTGTLTGTAEAGALVRVYRDGNTLVGSQQLAINGSSYSIAAALADGAHNYTVTATDAAGNVSAASPALTVTQDTAAPVVALTSKGGAVYSFTQTVSGTVTDANAIGTTVTLSEGKTMLGTATVQKDGSWSASIALSGYGDHVITATDADLAGNVGQAQTSYSVIYVAPAPDLNGSFTQSPGPGETLTLSGKTSGSLEKDGAGTLIITGTNTYTGPTTVKAGTLIVDGSIVSPVTVASGAVLGGHGSTGTVTVSGGGTLSPGNSPGILSTKDLTLAAGAVLKEEIGGTGAGQFDQLKVTGTVALNGATLDVSAFGAFASARNDSFVFIDNDGTDAVQGTFAGLSEGTNLSLGSHSYRISYHGGDGNDVALTDVTRPSEAVLDLFGFVEHSTASKTAGLYGLYEAILDRAPDVSGLQSFTVAMQTGMSLADVAQALLTSAEHGPQAASSTAFVESLYHNLLNRSADASGLATFTGELAQGVSQATVAVQIATSAEAQTVIKPAFDAGVFVPDASETAVARLYYGLLDRAPDAGGLQAFEGVVKQGLSGGGAPGAVQALKGVASAMLASPEYAASHGSLTNSAFVDGVYEGALGRHADPGGLAAWQDALAHGASRAEVALAISQSAEAQNHLLNQIEQGWHLA